MRLSLPRNSPVWRAVLSHVRFWPIADFTFGIAHVRFWE
jgi:hypothetical protein